MLRPFRGITPTVASGCYIDPSAQVIGDVQLGPQSSVWMNAVLRGDVHSIRIGSRSNVQDCAVIHGQRNLYPVIIGDGCTIGHNATVHGCTLEDDVLIGIGAIVLNGAHIGTGSIIAAGALVSSPPTSTSSASTPTTTSTTPAFTSTNPPHSASRSQYAIHLAVRIARGPHHPRLNDYCGLAVCWKLARDPAALAFSDAFVALS
jgi:carbonic anhydrase/acetyltransferase-like protein (isoleucine patch superfamily)